MDKTHTREMQQVEYTSDIARAIASAVTLLKPDRVFLLTDSNVARLLLPLPDGRGILPEISVITVPAGEEHKDLDTLRDIWMALENGGATRRSLLLNLGGGVVTDCGGFAAATYKRGIRFINIPTTLLAVADAAIGGKTGVNFNGLKNEIGAFAPAESVIIWDKALRSMPGRLRLDGLAETIKMALLGGDCWRELTEAPDPLADDILLPAARHAADAKLEIVRLDPEEHDLRRILNLGHTSAHAFESLARKRGIPLSHGEAVAHGLAVAMRLSERLLGFSAEERIRYEERILSRLYSTLPFGRDDAGALIRLMESDKKNPAKGTIRFILLRGIGLPEQHIIEDTSLIADTLREFL